MLSNTLLNDIQSHRLIGPLTATLQSPDSTEYNGHCSRQNIGQATIQKRALTILMMGAGNHDTYIQTAQWYYYSSLLGVMEILSVWGWYSLSSYLYSSYADTYWILPQSPWNKNSARGLHSKLFQWLSTAFLLLLPLLRTSPMCSVQSTVLADPIPVWSSPPKHRYSRHDSVLFV